MNTLHKDITKIENKKPLILKSRKLEAMKNWDLLITTLMEVSKGHNAYKNVQYLLAEEGVKVSIGSIVNYMKKYHQEMITSHDNYGIGPQTKKGRC